MPLNKCLFSSPAEAEKVWGNKKRSHKTVYATFLERHDSNLNYPHQAAHVYRRQG